MFDAERDVTVYFELDAIGNVRRLRAGHRTDPSNTDPLPSDLGGYRYSAFGKLKAPDAATPAPALDGDTYQQPFRWQGRPYLDIAGGLYDFRARTWSPELGAFLQADKFEFLGPSTTLWSWPGQNPIRNRDTTGRINLVSLNASSIGASILATVSRGITASVARAFSTAAVFTPVAQAAADKAKSAVVVGWRVGNLVFGRLTSSGSALANAAQGAVSVFGKLSQAGRYGVQPYNELAKALKGTGLQAHHLIEQRFASVLGQNMRQMLSVAVTRTEHQAFTNAWRARIPYGPNGTGLATKESVLQAAREIYADHPTILAALGL